MPDYSARQGCRCCHKEHKIQHRVTETQRKPPEFSHLNCHPERSEGPAFCASARKAKAGPSLRSEAVTFLCFNPVFTSRALQGSALFFAPGHAVSDFRVSFFLSCVP